MESKEEVSQMKFNLCCNSGTELKDSDQLTIVVNGVDTMMLVSEVFESYKQKDSYLKGYSLLSKLPIQGNFMIGPNSEKVCFKNKTTEELIFVDNIEAPFWQLNDREFGADQKAKFDIIFAKFEHNAEEEKIEESANAFDTEKKDYIEDGYAEFSTGDYRMLFKNGSDPILIKLVGSKYEYIEFDNKGKVGDKFILSIPDGEVSFDGKSIEYQELLQKKVEKEAEITS